MKSWSMEFIVSRSSAKPWLRSTIASVVCSSVKTARGPLGAPCASGCEEVGTRADVDAAAWGRTPEAEGDGVDEGGTAAVEGWIDMADTRLIRTCTFPLVDRRLYVCGVAGCRARRRGAVIAREGEEQAAARATPGSQRKPSKYITLA